MTALNIPRLQTYILTTIILSTSVSALQTIVLDTKSDLFGWKLRGDYSYLPSGQDLSIKYIDNFPTDYPFQSVATAVGVWAIFPIEKSKNASNKVTFSFATSARLLDRVMVRHNSGGKPIINILSNNYRHTEMPEVVSDGWTDITVRMPGTNTFTIETIATMEKDYILIDRIETSFQETTTTTHKPRSTTEAPIPTSQASPLSFLAANYLFWICFWFAKALH